MNLKLRRGAEADKPSTLEYGEPIVTDSGNLYVGNKNNVPMKVSDIVFLTTLTGLVPVEGKVYIVKSTGKSYEYNGTKLVEINKPAPHYSINVMDFGTVDNTGSRNTTVDIQKIIDDITNTTVGEGGVVLFFPPGVYKISTLMINKPVRIFGTGRATLFSRDTSVFSNYMFDIMPTYGTSYHYELKDFFVHGNKSELVGITTRGEGTGIRVSGAYSMIMEKIYVIECQGHGIKLDVNSTGVACKNSRLYNVWGYGAGMNNLWVHSSSVDTHVIGGDWGAATLENIYLGSPSSRVSGVTAWGSKTSHGITIANVSCQVTNSNVEGNRGHGINIIANHAFISGNKIYCNSYAADGSNPKDYSGIYVGAYKGVDIIDNKIYAGVTNTSESSEHKFAIELAVGHSEVSIFGNAMRFTGKNGVVSATGTNIVSGLNNTDNTDYSWTKSFFTSTLSAVLDIPPWTWTKIPVTVGTDREAEFSNTTYEFIPKNYGIYEFQVNFQLDLVPDGCLTWVSIFKNGTENTRLALQRSGVNATKWALLSGICMIELAAGDKIDVRVQSDLAIKTFSGSYMRFNGKLLK